MNLTVIRQNGQYAIDSREVAEMIDRPHNDLMKSIRSYAEYLTQGVFPLSDFFIPSTYQDSTGRTLPCYLLTRKGCDMVANKMTGEKGVLFTAAYVTKFVEMEKQAKQFIVPQNMGEALRLAADLWEEKQALLPKGQAYDSFIGKENLYTINEVAKKLAVPNMGEKNLFTYLRGRGILSVSKSRWNEPYQDYVNSGYFVLRDGKPWKDSNGKEHIPKQTFVTPRGVDFIHRMLKKDGYISVEEVVKA